MQMGAMCVRGARKRFGVAAHPEKPQLGSPEKTPPGTPSGLPESGLWLAIRSAVRWHHVAGEG